MTLDLDQDFLCQTCRALFKSNLMNNPQWLDRHTYPFSSHYFAQADGQMHYLDQGQGTPIVLVHGTPTWSFMFRHLIGPLSQNHRVLALDHLGFGLSDKPKTADYSVQAQAARFTNWIEQLDLPPFHLLVHDFGGPIALPYALQHPQKVKSLTIANTWMWSARGEEQFDKLAKTLASPILPLLYRWFNFSARFLIPQGFGNRKHLSKAVHRHFLAPFRLGEREGPLGFAHSLLEAQDWFEGLWQQRNNLATIPSQILWGEQDKFLPSSYAERFATIWPESAPIIRFKKEGHFLWEEAPEEILVAIEDFIK